MKLQLNRNTWRQVRRRGREVLLQHQRWVEGGAATVGLLLGLLAIYWWLWRPVPAGEGVGPRPVQLETATIQQVTEWAAARRERRVEVDSGLNNLFR